MLGAPRSLMETPEAEEGPAAAAAVEAAARMQQIKDTVPSAEAVVAAITHILEAAHAGAAGLKQAVRKLHQLLVAAVVRLGGGVGGVRLRRAQQLLLGGAIDDTSMLARARQLAQLLEEGSLQSVLSS